MMSRVVVWRAYLRRSCAMHVFYRLLRYNLHMTSRQSWDSRFTHEINQAEGARRQGNEGKARVCARRAVGIIVAEYLMRQGVELSNPSAYVHMKAFLELPTIPPMTREIMGHFILRITPDHVLPIDADLIAEAHWLARELLSK